MTKTRWVVTVSDRDWLIAKIRANGMKVKILKAYLLTLGEAAEGFELDSDNAEEKISKLALKLKRFFKKNWIPTRNFSLAFSCSGVITRIVTVPVMKKKFLEVLFTEQVEQYFTLNVADYIIDYRVLNEVEEEGQKRYKILLTAVPRDFWETQMSLLQKAKLKPKAIDVQFECLSRLYKRSDLSDCVILNLTDQRAEIVILEQGVFFLFAEVFFDSKELVRISEELAKGSSLNGWEKAAEIEAQPNLDSANLSNTADNLKSMDSFYSMEAADGSDTLSPLKKPFDIVPLNNIEGTINQELAHDRTYLEELENVFFPVMRNLEEFLSFFTSRHFGKNVDMIYITGKYTVLRDIDRVFRTNLELPTQIGYPEALKLKLSKKATKLNADVTQLGGLIGLALRED